MEHKKCRRCGETKAISEFYTKLNKPTSWCKVCTRAERHERWHATHPQPPPYVIPTEKMCNKCGETKPLEQFHQRKLARDGRNSVCATCAIAAAIAFNRARPEYHRQKAKEYRERHPDRHADNNLKCRLGLPWGSYAAMLAAQEGKCAICDTTDPGARTRRFHVDHDAQTGAVRGLLCSRCNTGIGQLRHDPVIIAEAMRYLLSKSPGV